MLIPEFISLIFWPVIVLTAILFLIVRLRLFSGSKIPGRVFLIFGGIVLFVATVWQSITRISDYHIWFLDSVYPYLDFMLYILLLAGTAFIVIGMALYADFWQTRKEDIEIRENKLSILDDLQRDAREPLPLLDLLNISTREIVAHLPECSGALFLLNRSHRRFILASSVGLTKPETAALEYYPLERNIVSQAVALGYPLIGSEFEFNKEHKTQIKSRFNSCLVLPLISGTEKIGGIILLSSRERFFGNSEIRYLFPVAEWLAEKIKSARLSRELSMIKDEFENRQESYSDLTTRFLSAAAAFSSHDPVVLFCRSLTGMASAKSVYLIGMTSGTFQIYGGSEPIEELTENYKTALIDALDKQKPLIVNQEAATEEGRSYIAVSSLIYPLGDERTGKALLFRKESSPFEIDKTDLKNFGIFARLAVIALEQIDSKRLDINRRKGFKKILQLLRWDKSTTGKEDWDSFVDHLSEILPTSSVAIVFKRENDGSLSVSAGYTIDRQEVPRFIIKSGESNFGSSPAGFEPLYTYGRHNVNSRLELYETSDNEAFFKIFGGRQTPVFMATCPITVMVDMVAVLTIFLFDITENEKGEWERLITLTAGLYSTRLTVAQLLRQESQRATSAKILPENMDETINRLNNHFSAIVGNAELAQGETDIPAKTKSHLDHIINETEQAAGFLKQSMGRISAGSPPHYDHSVNSENIDSLLQSFLRTVHISENVYMIDGKPREVDINLNSHESVTLPGKNIRRLLERALSYFSSRIKDDDIINIATYPKDRHIYLDISRHQEDFPPVEEVAGFGDYQPVEVAFRQRPYDNFLNQLVGKNCLYAYDRFGQIPSYLSFSFPVKAITATDETISRPTARILAIDDQPVILDLISAMCHSLGYDPLTASSGEEGVKLAARTNFDIVLTDLAMPGMSGLDVARRIRQINPRIPIVLVTGWEANLSRIELEASGITEVLYKPFRIEQLTEIIQSLISSRILS